MRVRLKIMRFNPEQDEKPIFREYTVGNSGDTILFPALEMAPRRRWFLCKIMMSQSVWIHSVGCPFVAPAQDGAEAVEEAER